MRVLEKSDGCVSSFVGSSFKFGKDSLIELSLNFKPPQAVDIFIQGAAAQRGGGEEQEENHGKEFEGFHSAIATTRVGPPEPPLTFIGRAITEKPFGGSSER